METSPPTAQFHDKMTKINLKTFSQIKRKSTIQRQAKEIVRKADRSLFGQMLIIAQSRQLHMKDVLSHPLGPLLWALAKGDGKHIKQYLPENWKSLLHQLKRSLNHIINGMSIVQKVKGNDKMFSELA